MKSLIALFLTSFTLSSLLVPLTRRLFLRLGKLDQPDARKLHKIPVPRSGGVALIAAYLISIGILLLLPAGGNFVIDRYGGFLSRLLPAIGIVWLTGFLDDIFNLSARQKLLGQFAASAFAWWAGIRLFDVPPGFEFAGFLATAFWLILSSNAFNLTDGTDGLAGTLGVLSCLGIISVALSLNYYSLAFVFMPLLGAIIPFLRANWPPATLFLGDAGSLTLGFLIGCGGAALSRRFPHGEGFAAALLILTLPLMEVTLSTVRRLLRGQPVFSPDSFHIHHQLKRQGHGDSQVLLRLGALSLTGTIIAVAQIWLSPAGRLGLVFPFLFYLGFKVSSLRYPEFMVLGEALWGGRIRAWFRHQILLRTLESDLAAASNSLTIGALLEDAASRLGLLDLALRLPGHTIHPSPIPSSSEGTYLVRIDLPGHNWVNYRVPVILKRTENPAADLAAIITRVLTAQRLRQLLPAIPPVAPQPSVTPVSGRSG